MTTQAELEFFETSPADPNVGWLEELLDGAGCWMKASDVVRTYSPNPMDDPSDSEKRYVRELASASEWIISGQKGYKHLRHATAEEIQHAAAWLESQAKKMGDRAGAIRRNAHKVFG